MNAGSNLCMAARVCLACIPTMRLCVCCCCLLARPACQVQEAFDPLEIPFGPAIDAQADRMIAWADVIDRDGMVSFEEYRQVIQAGCTPDGDRLLDKARRDATATAESLLREQRLPRASDSEAPRL